MKKLLTLAFAFTFVMALCAVSVAQEAADSDIMEIEAVETGEIPAGQVIEGYADVCGPVMPGCCPRRPFLRRSCPPCMPQPAYGCDPCMPYGRPQHCPLFGGRQVGYGYGAPCAEPCGMPCADACMPYGRPYRAPLFGARRAAYGYGAPCAEPCGYGAPAYGCGVSACDPCGYPGVRVGNTPIRNFFQRICSQKNYYGTAYEMGTYGYGCCN